MLDQERIEITTPISSRLTAVETMPDRAGTNVAEDLGDRYLARYLTSAQVPEFLDGSSRGHWVTPTALSPNDVVPWLALYAPMLKRQHLLLINPSKVDVIRGPAWIRLGQGIEYYLPHGFPKSAIVDVGVLQVR
ncbi:MAG TPA: hypothetical protein VII16_08475 [Actinomycetes bacterium]|jgi:hypothetical protein